MNSSRSAWYPVLAVVIRAGVAAVVVLNGERVLDVRRIDLLKYPARMRRGVLAHALRQLAADYSVSTVVAESATLRRFRLRASGLTIERTQEHRFESTLLASGRIRSQRAIGHLRGLLGSEDRHQTPVAFAARVA